MPLRSLRARAERFAASRPRISIAAQTPARTSSSSRTAPGARTTRFPPRCRAGAGAGRRARRQGSAQEILDEVVGEARLAEGQRRAADRRLLRRVHGRGARRRRSASTPLKPLLAEIDADARRRRACSAMIGRFHAIGDRRAVRARLGGSDNHKPTRRDRPDRRRRPRACPTATTT